MPKIVRRLAIVSKLAGLTSVVVGCLVLCGWTLNIATFKQIVPGLVAMNPLTAVAFILAGLALLLLRVEQPSPTVLHIAQLFALTIVCIGLSKLAAIVFTSHAGIDQLLFPTKLGAMAGGVPNRMAPNTALNFVLVGVALLLLHRPIRGGRWPAQWFVFLAGTLTLLPLIGYAYGITFLYGIGSFIPMAVHTAVTFLIIEFGLLAMLPRCSFMTMFTSNTSGGVIARRLLPMAIMIPLVLGWLRLAGQHAGLYDTEAGTALLTLADIIIFTLIITSNAHLLYRGDGELRVAEQSLRQRMAQKRALLSAIPDLMLRYNQQGMCLDYKPFTTGGFPLPSRVIGTTISGLLPPGVAAIVQTAIEQVLHTGDQLSLDFEYPTSNGCTDYEARFSPCGDGEVVCLIQDISNRKAIERLKNEFVSMVSHELRTPLTSIRGSLGLVDSGITGTLPPQAQALVSIAHKNCERLVRLINDILDVDKIESGKMQFELQPLCLLDIVSQAIESIRDYGVQFGVCFQLQASDADVHVMADADRLTQVLTNLLSNAAKYSPHDGTVEVGMVQHGSQVRVTVVDHGPGISAEFEQRIFQKFAQADSSTTRQKGGTGLGLSISKAIVEQLNGHIGFTSMVNRGTSFHIELPVLTSQGGTTREG